MTHSFTRLTKFSYEENNFLLTPNCSWNVSVHSFHINEFAEFNYSVPRNSVSCRDLSKHQPVDRYYVENCIILA